MIEDKATRNRLKTAVVHKIKRRLPAPPIEAAMEDAVGHSGLRNLPLGPINDADTPTDEERSKDDVDTRMAKIAEILDHAAMHLLEKCALVAEWVHYAEILVSGHVVRKPEGGRPEGGVAQAARHLSVPGKTPEARRKFIERAIKIDGIWLEAKSASRAAGLDDVQSDLLAIARERSPQAQIAKVQEIAARKAAPRRRLNTPNRGDDAAKPARVGPAQTEAIGDTVQRVNGAGENVEPPGANDRSPREALSVEESATLAALEESWTDRDLLSRQDWSNASPAVQHRFVVDVLLKAPVLPTSIASVDSR